MFTDTLAFIIKSKKMLIELLVTQSTTFHSWWFLNECINRKKHLLSKFLITMIQLRGFSTCNEASL